MSAHVLCPRLFPAFSPAMNATDALSAWVLAQSAPCVRALPTGRKQWPAHPSLAFIHDRSLRYGF